MKNIIINQIRQSQNQLISYAEFIETALYHPEHGYYMRDQQKIGKGGDFITTSNVSDVFGTILAKWFLNQVVEQKITPAICEIGAGNGRFAKAFLDAWHKNTDISLDYLIVDSSPFHRKLQRELLSNYQTIQQYNHVAELKEFNGLVLSNELFDALPVHVIEKANDQLMEIMIGWNGNEFFEQSVPLTNINVRAFINEYQLTLVNDQRIEVPVQMEKMLIDINDMLENGLMVTIDYGYTNEEWANPARRSGSLRGYFKHQMMNNILEHPGEMDITHHIHFDPFITIGDRLGLKTILKLRQDEFLVAAGILKELEDNYDPNPFSERSKRNRAIKNLVMPGMSSYFHVIIQQKGINLRRSELFDREFPSGY
jgi:SAM-dependent MidA family methyltransferase